MTISLWTLYTPPYARPEHDDLAWALLRCLDTRCRVDYDRDAEGPFIITAPDGRRVAVDVAPSTAHHDAVADGRADHKWSVRKGERRYGLDAYGTVTAVDLLAMSRAYPWLFSREGRVILEHRAEPIASLPTQP